MQPMDGIFYTKDEETPLKTVEWISFLVSFFLFEMFWHINFVSEVSV